MSPSTRPIQSCAVIGTSRVFSEDSVTRTYRARAVLFRTYCTVEVGTKHKTSSVTTSMAHFFLDLLVRLIESLQAFTRT